MQRRKRPWLSGSRSKGQTALEAWRPRRKAGGPFAEAGGSFAFQGGEVVNRGVQRTQGIWRDGLIACGLLVAVAVILGLLVACSLIAFTLGIWFVPPHPGTRGVALADLDGDGDLDAFLANGRNEYPEPNTVLLNDGKGRFQDTGQQLGHAESWAVVLHDFDNDGDADALVSNGCWGKYFWNDGSGYFPESQTYFPGSHMVSMPEVEGYAVGLWRFKLADLNSDGVIDLFLTGCCGGGASTGPDDWRTLNAFNTVWLGAPGELPRDTGQAFGQGSSEAVDLGDLDGDGDLDAIVANSSYLDAEGEPVDYDPNRVWLNDGRGTFVDSGQKLGTQPSYSIALGDLDGDGDLDASWGTVARTKSGGTMALLAS
jgi:hypothetical protein